MSSNIVAGDTTENTVVETSVPEAPINRFNAFTSLELKLALVRQEIDCWEEALTEQAAVSGSDGGAAEPDVVGAHVLVAAADPASYLYLPAPPVEFDYDRLVMVGSPAPRLATSAAPGLPLVDTGTTGYGPEIDLFIEEVSAALNPAGGMPEMTTVLTQGRAKDEVVKRRRSRPVLIREVWEEPAYIAERTPIGELAEGPTRPTLAAGVDVAQLVVEEVAADNWDETFGDVEELFSIVRNQMDCWQALEVSDAAQVEQFESSLRYTDSKN